MQSLLEAKERESLLKYFENSFGLDSSHFESTHFFARKESIWIVDRDLSEKSKKLALDDSLQGWKICSGTRIYKPSYAFAQRMGHLCSQGTIELEREDAMSFFSLKKLKFNSKALERGYVLVKYQYYFIGVAFWDGDSLVSQYPKKLCSQISNKNFS